jgi:hypothetical protein
MNLERLNYTPKQNTNNETPIIVIVPTITCNTKYDICDGIEKAILKATNDISFQRKRIIKKKIYCILVAVCFVSCIILFAILGALVF